MTTPPPRFPASVERPDAIKRMGLYRQPERVLLDLRAAGIDDEASLTEARLCAFDQYHYDGTAALDLAIAELPIGPATRILEIGSGLGGPARYLAEHTGCQVTAVELQDDLAALARTLTARCGLSAHITQLEGDILTLSVPTQSFDAVVSWLAFLHIPDKARLLARCAQALVPGGHLWVEDFYARAALTDRERALLRSEVFCRALPSHSDYRRELEAQGFQVERFEDCTARWTTVVQQRAQQFRADLLLFVARYGAPTANALERFYAAMAELFAGGRLGGVRLRARMLGMGAAG